MEQGAGSIRPEAGVTAREPSAGGSGGDVQRLYAAAEGDFPRYEVLKDIVDELLDISLNYRQSGHPGGSRSKAHMLVALMLSGAMRWDIRRPWLRFADRFVLSAGHTVPLVYSSLAVLNEAMRQRHARTGEDRFAFPDNGNWALTWEWLLRLRRHKGLPGHAEMSGRSLFLKFNTGPSGHGMAPAAGEALALQLAGAEEVKVFVMEGEGGLTTGGSHEARHTAWGLGLSNLVFLIDWNDYGIDPRPASSVVHGGPEDWFAPYGWRVTGTEHGMQWGSVALALLESARGENPEGVPGIAWFKTRKGRGYGKYDDKSHGTPWSRNSEQYWSVRRAFMARYGVEYVGLDAPAPAGETEMAEQAAANLEVAMSVLVRDEPLVEWLSDRLVELAASVPERVEGFRMRGASARRSLTARVLDSATYPGSIWRLPGDRVANRAALAAWGSYVNGVARREMGVPLFVACSPDLAGSTSIDGFANDFEDMAGFGWYERSSNPVGALLPTEITEFANAGLMTGLASVNLADGPFEDFDGFWGACSTYAAFSYLKYGPMRLFSQLAQDCELKLGRVLWVAGHSGPETAEDSRTHFGVLETGVTDLFPAGQVLDVHPWEYNEVPAVLAAAFATEVPIVALHLTRPPIEIPDRQRLGMPSHFAAVRGAYVIRPFRDDQPRGGTVFVRGSKSTDNLVSILPELDLLGLNVKVVAAISPQLFDRQPRDYRDSVIDEVDRADAMVITNGAFRLMHHWAGGPLVRRYSLCADWDDRWRSGGTVDEVMAEARLSADIMVGIDRFVKDRGSRLSELSSVAERAWSR